MVMQKPMTLSPVGHVSVGAEGFALRVEEPFRTGLRGLEGFSHVAVLFWCDRSDTPDLRRRVECEQPYRKAPATLGVFATRSPERPNPIALTPARVLAVDPSTGIVRVAYLDAEDGSPVLDIKPYQPCVDRVRDVSTPEWCAHWPGWYEDSGSFDWAAEFVNAR